jgi:polysaccharide transporter, PST family
MLTKLVNITQSFSPGFRRILGNTLWLVADKVARMGMGLIVGIWVARYLGPGQFGLLNYALSFVGLFLPITSLGLNQLIVRDLVSNEKDRYEILGAGFFAKTIAGVVTILVINIVSLLIYSDGGSDNNLLRLVIFIISLSSIFQSFEVIDFWFQSRLEVKDIVIPAGIGLLVISFLKIIAIQWQSSLVIFSLISLLESIFVALNLIIVYWFKKQKVSYWKYDISTAKRLVREGSTLLLSSFVAVIYMKIDQVMLGQLLNNEAVGLYGAAVRISECWYFIPTAITASLLPVIMKAKQNGEKNYHKKMQKLFHVLALFALLMSVLITVFSDSVILSLYGKDYIGASRVLCVHIWSSVFVFFGVAQSPWNIAEGLQKISLLRGILGAIVNVVLNLLLIPQYGPLGASIATLISYAIANYLANLFDKRTLEIFMMQSRALFLVNLKTVLLKG